MKKIKIKIIVFIEAHIGKKSICIIFFFIFCLHALLLTCLKCLLNRSIMNLFL